MRSNAPRKMVTSLRKHLQKAASLPNRQVAQQSRMPDLQVKKEGKQEPEATQALLALCLPDEKKTMDAAGQTG
jgi:hypothetical protein